MDKVCVDGSCNINCETVGTILWVCAYRGVIRAVQVSLTVAGSLCIQVGRMLVLVYSLPCLAGLRNGTAKLQSWGPR